MDILKLVQHNIQSINNKKPLLQTLLFENEIDICLLNETWLKSSQSHFYMSGYDFIFKNAENEHGGVAFLIKSSIKYVQLSTPNFQDVQTIAISVDTKVGPLTILCVYCPPKNKINMSKLKNIITSLPKPYIISGDFNAHHVAFGCTLTKTRGKNLYDLIDDLNLCILNTGSATTVRRPNDNISAIDVTLVSPELVPLCDWYVGEDPLGSYHYPTFTNIIASPNTYEINKNLNKYMYNKANWEKYYFLSESHFNNFKISNEDPVGSYNKFCSILNNLKDECVPKLRYGTKKKDNKAPAPWWNDICAKAVKDCKLALGIYRRNLNMENYLNYKKMEAKKKRIIKEEKRKSWKNLCTTFNRYTPISRIMNFIKRFNRLKIGSNSKNDSFIPEFFDKFTKTEVENVTCLENLFAKTKEDKNNEFLLKQFSWDEFNSALLSRKDSTPGLDDFPYLMIKKLHKVAQLVLLNIYNLLWSFQVVPESWKTQCILPILKNNKPIQDHNSYRPISLTSCVGKIFEHMIKVRLDYFVEINSLLPDYQLGFRRGKSAVEGFVSVIADIKKSILAHSNAICVFLDVEGAYDNVNLFQLIRVLSELKIPGKLLRWIFNYLYNRTVYVKFNNIIHGPKYAHKGLMQGAILSPILYNLYTSQIQNYIKENNINIIQYADDLVMYSINQNINIAKCSINQGLSQLQNFYHNKLKLNINSSKSSVMLFGKSNCNVQVKYNCENIPIVKEKKFLGVIIDKKLNFNSHIDCICKRAYKRINILRYLAGVFWGADAKILSILYKSIVRSHFDYSCIAYINASPSLLKKLDIIQNRALRIITGAMKSTPINSMEIETGIPPLILRRLMLAQKFFLKMLAINSSLPVRKLMLAEELSSAIVSSNIINAQSINSAMLPQMSAILHLTINISKSIYSSSLWPVYEYKFESTLERNFTIILDINSKSELLRLLDLKNDFCKIYTDGSKNTQEVKAAFFDSNLDCTKCVLLNNNCSIFTAECYAIYMALLYVNSSSNIRNVIIISDSKSALLSINSCKLTFKTNYLVFKIRNLLYNLNARNVNVELVWVPSHRGIAGNEIADQAARDGYDEDHRDVVKTPFSDYFPNIKDGINRLWKDYWTLTNQNKGQWYAKIQKVFNTKPWYNNISYDSRKFISIITRMRFGHCLTPSHLFKLKIIQDPKCTKCNEPYADLNHIIFKCESLKIHRLILASDINNICAENKINIPRRPEDILANPRFFKPLFKFIRSSIEKI